MTFIITLISAATSVAVAQQPDVIEVHISGQLDDSADTDFVLDQIGGTSRDWTLSIVAERNSFFPVPQVVGSSITGSFAGLEVTQSSDFFGAGAIQVSFDGRLSNRTSMIGGAVLFPFDGIDFSITTNIVGGAGTFVGYEFAAFAPIVPDRFDFGDTVTADDLSVNKFELRDVFGGDPLTTGSLTEYTVNIIPSPGALAVLLGGIAVARRRRCPRRQCWSDCSAGHRTKR